MTCPAYCDSQCDEAEQVVCLIESGLTEAQALDEVDRWNDDEEASKQ